MRIYLPNKANILVPHFLTQVCQPFNSYLPMANICQYDFQDGQILLQELSSELFSIASYEAFLKAELIIEFELPHSLTALFFTLNGSVTIKQLNIPKYVQDSGQYVLAYCPANTKLGIVLPRGNTTLFRIDYKEETLRELSEDYLLIQTMLLEAQKESPFSRRLYSAPIDPFVRLSIRQIFEYGETKSERSLFIYARCIDLLRHYVHSIHPQQWDEATDERSTIAQLIKITVYIDQHLDTALSKHSIAKRHNTSIRSLERHFMQYYRQSIGKYILLRRMSKAQEMLKETSISLLDISLSVGYSELTNFTRAFKTFYGYLPSHLRK